MNEEFTRRGLESSEEQCVYLRLEQCLYSLLSEDLGISLADYPSQTLQAKNIKSD